VARACENNGEVFRRTERQQGRSVSHPVGRRVLGGVLGHDAELPRGAPDRLRVASPPRPLADPRPLTAPNSRPGRGVRGDAAVEVGRCQMERDSRD